MQFNNGTPSLLSFTQDKAGDPASAASKIWTEPEEELQDAVG